MHFNPPQPGNNPANPFWHPLNQNLNEENRLQGMDQGEAMKIYNKLKKGSEIEVEFGNAISSGGRPITLRVTSGHRIVGKSRVGRIILVNPENPRGMKYKLFNRDGRISLAQSDMATILKSMKILKEDVQLDEMKKSDGPFTVVALKGNKVVGQIRNVEHYDIEVAIDMMRKDKQGAKISVESKSGKVVHTESVELDEKVKTAFDDFDTDTRVFLAKLKKFGFEKEYKKMIMNFNKHANPGDGFYFIDGGRELGFQVHPVSDMMMGPKIKKLGDTQDLGGGKTVRLIAIKENVQLDESSLPAYDARLLRQALVLGKNAFKAGKKRQPLKDKNLVSLRGFAKGKGKNEVMKQWLKGWDEENLKEDVQLDESRDDFDYLDMRAASDDRMFAAKKFMDALKKAGIKHEYVRSSGTMRVARKDLGKAQSIGKRLKVDKDGVRMDVLREDVQLDEMSAKQHYNKMVAQGKVGRGGRLVTPIDRKRFPNREKEGLEGPFRSRKSGQVYYYDKKAGKYYDPLSDMYLQVKDIMESKSLFDISPTSSKWMKGRLRTGYNQSQKSGMPKEVFKKGQIIDLHPFDGDRFVGAKSPKDKGSYFFVAKRNVDAMNESVQIEEEFGPANYESAIGTIQSILYMYNNPKFDPKVYFANNTEGQLFVSLFDYDGNGLVDYDDLTFLLSLQAAGLPFMYAFTYNKYMDSDARSGVKQQMGTQLQIGKTMGSKMSKPPAAPPTTGSMRESVQLGESFEFQFPTKKIAQNFMREISQEGLGSSTGTRDGQVTTHTHSGRVGEPTMAHMKMARIMKRYSGKLVRTTEGPRMAKIFEATTPLRKKVAAAKAKLKKAGIASAFQFGELYVHDKDLKKAMSIIGGDRDLLLVGQPMPLTKDDLMDGI